MNHRLIILPQARADVQRNALWWSTHHSSEQAARWLDAVQSQLESIAEFPESHSLAAENDDFAYEIREKRVGLGARPRYRAVFTLADDAIYVLAIRAAEQNRLTEDQVGFDV
ncbi:type II toxin-antitoxin system RelE/ParE family toxin [Rosistilla oblonga]|uniref:type II toxin-antitoxin system RelE/ParE family toxin n=1 Tax=Rosistilla oblonga TaxID=2527990 RepID=UPI003A97D45A